MSIGAMMMKRRRFLAAAIGLGGALAAGGCALRSALPAIPGRPEPDAAAAAGWIVFDDGRYALVLPRVEMGQNISIALKQIAAEELGVGLEEIELRLHDTDAIAPVRATVGSDSVKDFALPLARAAAALREAVAAGRTEGVIAVEERPASALRAFQGAHPGKRRIIGQTPPPEQGEAIVRGQPLFAADIRLPGMLHGRVLRAPVSPELPSRPVAWNRAAAEAEPGFVALVEDARLRQGNSLGLGILARMPGALDRIAEALAVEWSVEGGFDAAEIDAALDVDRRLEEGGLRYTVLEHGESRPGPADVDLAFVIPAAPHGQIEPRAAVAEEDETGRLTLWAGTQDAFYVRAAVAKALGRAEAEIRVQTCRVGGGFGGKALCLAEIEAALLASAAGAPVKVQWTRAQEYLSGFHRPPTRHRVRARLADGALDDWRCAFVSSHILFTNAAMPRWMQWGTDLVAGDPGVARGAAPPYRSAAARVEYDLVRLPLLGGPWRGLGAGPNAIVTESAIDDCARAAGADPVAFRLAHIDDPRLAAVLRRAVALADAAPERAATGQRVGRGVACGIYKAMSYAAAVAEVVIAPDGAVRVARLWCAHDCGMLVNPDQVRAQCEGNLVWGVSMVLHEKLTVAQGAVSERTLAESGLPRMSDMPEISVELIETDVPPTGAGETAMVCAGAALNAIREATGRRITRLPVDPDLLRT